MPSVRVITGCSISESSTYASISRVVYLPPLSTQGAWHKVSTVYVKLGRVVTFRNP